MKMIRSNQLNEDLLKLKRSGMAWKSMEKVWIADSKKTYSTIDAFNKVQKGDEMLFKFQGSNFMYKGEVDDIKWGNLKNRENELIGEPWVHCFIYSNITPIGKRELYKNKGKLEFLKKFSNPGLPFKTGMWNISKEDFEMVINNFI